MPKINWYRKYKAKRGPSYLTGKMTYKVGPRTVPARRVDIRPHEPGGHGFKIEKMLWDEKKRRVVASGKQEHEAINKRLEQYERWVNEIYDVYCASGRLLSLTPDAYQEELERRLYNLPDPAGVNMVPFMQEELRKAEATTNPNTLKLQRSALRHIESYFEHIGRELGFNDWTMKDLFDFVAWLQDTQNLNTNSANKVLKDGLFKFMRTAHSQGIHTNDIFRTPPRDLGISRTSTEYIALTLEEVRQIMRARITRKEHQAVRDIFVAACYTGLRFSDWGKLKPSNVITLTNGKPALQYTSSKGADRGHAKRILIPLHPTALECILRAAGRPLPSNAECNKILKDVAQAAGLIETEEIKVLEGRKFKIKQAARWELVTTHTARRTLKTNMKRGALDTETTKKLMGHSSDRTDAIYDKRTLEELAVKLSESDFFNDLDKPQ